MEQGTVLVCKQAFAFKVNGKGRTITARQGQRFWVMNSQVSQAASGIIEVGRVNVSKVGQGYEFTPEQVAEFFGTE